MAIDEEESLLFDGIGVGDLELEPNVTVAVTTKNVPDQGCKTCDQDATKSKATVTQTVVNLMKTCMGSGVLALSFACQQGGVILFCLGLPAVALWNIYAVHRLILCLGLISDKKTSKLPTQSSLSESQQEISSRFRRQNASSHASLHSPSKQHQLTETLLPIEPLQPPPGVTTMGRVAWHAFGDVGLQLLDASMLLLLLGIIVAYVAGSITFLGDSPFTLGPVVDGILCASVMAVLSLVPHVGHLSWVSATGLMILLATFIVIAGYGVKDQILDESTPPLVYSSVPVWPKSVTGMSHLFGIAVFSFGVAPLTYNFRSSMQQPQRMVQATCIALSLTSVSYIVFGVGMLLLYPNLQGDLLHELPPHGIVPTITRLAMVWVCIMTAPLLILPCSDLIQGKWQRLQSVATVRFGICMAAVLIAIGMPSFVQVLALVGCACVGLVGFCLPPLFHLKLSAPNRDYVAHQTSTWVLDCVMLTWGVVVTVLSTYYTFQRVTHD